MGIVRINAIGPSAVEYLLHGCDAQRAGADGIAPEGAEGEEPDGASEGDGTEQRERGAAGYFGAAIRAGEPPGVWWGRGMRGLDLDVEAGDLATEDDVRAIFGQLRYPERMRAGSTNQTPVYIGRAPRAYKTLTERVEAALKAEPDAIPERVREIEITTSRNTRTNTAYYDVTFSPAKSVSIYYAALLAAGDIDGARRVRWAHDEAVRIALTTAERDVAWGKVGRHGRAGPSGRTVGEWARGAGLSVVLFAHHTNRDNEPQLHAHAAVLNRVAVEDGRVVALDGQAFGPIKEAMSTAYTRANEQLVTDQTGAVFVTRSDGKAREIAGIDAALIAEGSTRTTDHVGPRVAELVAAYVDRHGHEPDQRARHRIAEMAVKATRQPKRGTAGPRAVAEWATPRAARLEAALDAVEEAGFDQTHVEPFRPGEAEARTEDIGAALRMAVTESFHALHRAEVGVTVEPELQVIVDRVLVAVDTGLEQLQSRYATWTVGNLVHAIDQHLGDSAGQLGLSVSERPEFVRWVADSVLDPTSGHGVVQVSGGDPVPVPDALRRLGPGGDGRSRFRAPIDERYSLAGHLDRERRLTATVRHGEGPRATADEVHAVRRGLLGDGFSADQVAVVAGILSSGRAVDVVVGPAGTGKSHTVGALARAWEECFGGRALGTATAQVATRNLSGLGLKALNTARLLAAFTRDSAGRSRDQLTPCDLVVVDEAGTTSTADLGALVDLGRAAGAKVVLVGDHHQLDAVEAGGMFAHLARQPGTHELTEVHRFVNTWESEASLQLRVGEPEAAAVYADHGRLRQGVLAKVQQEAVAGYLADRLEGKTSLLVVGTNEHATDLSRSMHRELVALGLVESAPLVVLRSEVEVAVGDLIQARLNDYRLRVDPARRQDGSLGPAWPVTNRETYRVSGRDPTNGDLLAIDARGATVHLPIGYVQDHVALAYAVTGNAAQGLTVDVGRAIVDRDADRASVYVPGSRGREANILYLVTEQDPDSHDPQRVQETAVGRLVDVLAQDRTEKAATTVIDEAASEMRSTATLAELFDRASLEQLHRRHAQAIADVVEGALGAEAAAGLIADPAYGALLAAVQRADLEGHAALALVRQATNLRDFRGARSVAQVLHGRVERLRGTRRPERIVDPGDWATLLDPPPGEVAEYVQDVARRLNHRQAELGIEVARERPSWAVEQLGSPDDAADRAEWEARAGSVAGWREWRGIPADQMSIGPLPPPSQQLARVVWAHVAALLPADPHDVREHTDSELRGRQARWLHELDVLAPRSVADDLAETYRLAHDARVDAVLGRARLDALRPDHPDRARLTDAVDGDEAFARQYRASAEQLEAAYEERLAWWERSTPVREAAQAATDELVRRGREAWSETLPTEENQPVGEVEELGAAFRRMEEAVRRSDLERAPTEGAHERVREAGAHDGYDPDRGSRHLDDVDRDPGRPDWGPEADSGPEID